MSSQLIDELSDYSRQVCSKFKMKDNSELKQYDKENLLLYINELHQLIKNNEKQLSKYKETVKNMIIATKGIKSRKHVINDNDNYDAAIEETTIKWQKDDDNTENLDNLDTASNAFSFVDEMRQAAQQAQNINNFIYEPTSGLYYDQRSGYYYNAECGLYYDGNTGCYYRYNEKKQSFEFHSQVQVQPTVNASKLQDDDPMETEVVFDEQGVVTDAEKLKRLRLERVQEQKNKVHYKARKMRQSKSHCADDKHEKKIGKSTKKHKRSRKSSHLRREDKNTDGGILSSKHEMEDGELSQSSTLSDSSSQYSDSGDEEKTKDKYEKREENKNKVPVFNSSSRFQDIANKYPPSLRIIVQDTNLDNLKVGNLSLITYKGGSLGREGNHDVIVPDVNVSKYHLKFMYDKRKSIYKCVDLGSRNGTILNGQRMSAAKKESAAYDLIHGSIIQIAQTKLLCHIHKGNSTCGLCEPGLLIDRPFDVSSVHTNVPNIVLSHKEQLKRLQKKYGLENEKFVENIKQQTAGSYSDRAATRRLNIGSSSDKEKTQTASVDIEIPSNNKGFKMLSKLGWNKGDSLGKSVQSGGLLEPINVELNLGTKGLGCQDPNGGTTPTVSDIKKFELMEKTKQRYLNADIVYADT